MRLLTCSPTRFKSNNFLTKLCQLCASQHKYKSSDIIIYQSFTYILLLTHLGSNQDSAEPKSDVLPITPWVSNTVSGVAKLEKFLTPDKTSGILTGSVNKRVSMNPEPSGPQAACPSFLFRSQRMDTLQAI